MALPASLRAAATRRQHRPHRGYQGPHVQQRRSQGRAVAYVRQSSPKGGEQGRSVVDQRVALRRLCKRLDLALLDVFAEAISGARRDRAQFWALLERLEAGDVDVVVVWQEDRLSRGDVVGQAQLLAVCRELGIRVITERGTEYRLDDAEDRRRLGYKLLEADSERDNIMARVRRGKEGAHKRGAFVAGAVPYGYRASGTRGEKRLVPTGQARVVQRIYEAYLAGTTANAIARELNENPRRGGRVWNAAAIGYVLDNPAYAGYLWYSRHLVQGGHRALVSLRTWEAVQRRRAARRARHPGRPKKAVSKKRGRELVVCKLHGDAFAVDLRDGLVVCRVCARGTYLEALLDESEGSR